MSKSSKDLNIEIIEATSSQDVAAVKALFLEYIDFVQDFLGEDLTFQGTEKEFQSFPDIYDVLLLGKLNGIAVAACGIKPFKNDICELKRLYCSPQGRGHKFGEKLTRMSLQKAKSFGYKHMYLDTNPDLVHANKIYEALGFEDIDQYYENPLVCSRYMALQL